MEQSLNMFDLVFIGLVGILAFIGLTRGAIRETFSIINICLSAAITVLMRPLVSSILIEKIKLQVIADIISNSIIFTISLVVISLICSGTLKTLSDKIPIYINQPFGFILGFLKGYLIMSVVIITMFSIYEVPINGSAENVLPDFITHAKTYNIVKKGANFIKPISDKLFENSLKSTDSLKNLINRDGSLEESNQETSKPNKSEDEAININNRFDREYQQTAEQQKIDDFGYPKKQIRKKNGLVEIFADDEDLVIE
jgi:uncharacterized membrane protein required for colicin V production